MMGKVMMKNNQAVGQTQKGAIHDAKSATKAHVAAEARKASGKPGKEAEEAAGFAAELAAVGAQGMQSQSQPAKPTLSTTGAQAAIAASGVAAQAHAAQGKEAAPSASGASPALNPKAAGLNTGSAIAGLKNPRAQSVGEWVFEGESPMTTGASAKTAADELPAQAAPKGEARPQVARGEADAALLGKLDMLSAIAAAQAGSKDAGAQSANDLQRQQAATLAAQQQGVMAGGAAAAHDNAALAAQLASLNAMGGAGVEGLGQGPDAGAAMAPNGARGRGLGALTGAKGKLPQGSSAQAAGLSGGEFLSMLGAVKAGGSRGSQQGGQAFGEGQQGEGQLGKGMSPGMGAKPGAKTAGKAESELSKDLTTAQSLGNLSAHHGMHAASATAAGGVAGEVTGHVVQGANAENRLSSEALANIAGNVRNIAGQGNSGEMRIRLRPENLGELHVRVVTDGRNVGLQIQASDEKAKKILEESLTHLKDSLASQSLSLASVDLSVGHAHGSGLGHPSGGDQNQQWQNPGHGMSRDMLGQGQSHGRDGRGGGAWDGAWGGKDAGAMRSNRGVSGGTAMSAAGAMQRSQPFGPARAAYAETGRIDVTA
jgi:flagellar hook-length control protein FliK